MTISKKKMYAGLATRFEAPEVREQEGWRPLYQIWMDGNPYLESYNLRQMVKILNTYNAKEARGEFESSPLILP